MSQITSGVDKLPTLESVVVSAQMIARREALQRLLSDIKSSDDTRPPPPLNRNQHSQPPRGMAATSAGDSTNYTGDPEHSPHVRAAAAPGAVASVLSVIGEGLLQGWWQGHPARAVAQVANSLLQDQARHHPKRLIAVSAALGSAIVILKPWRRRSMGKLLLTAVAGSSNGVVAKLFGMANDEAEKSEQTRR